MINVSSIKGKERKLSFPTNERLRIYRPLFIKPSFVKLDLLSKVPIRECQKLAMLMNGATLDTAELERIKGLLKRENKGIYVIALNVGAQ